MKLKELFENKFTYEVGDTVKTPFGPGVIEKELEQTEKDVYFNVRILGSENRKKFKLEDKPYRLGSSSLHGIIKKGKKINEAVKYEYDPEEDKDITKAFKRELEKTDALFDTMHDLHVDRSAHQALLQDKNKIVDMFGKEKKNKRVDWMKGQLHNLEELNKEIKQHLDSME